MQTELQAQPSSGGLRRKLSALGFPDKIRLTLDLPSAHSGFRRVLPFRRSALAITILAAMDVAMMIPAVLVSRQAIESWRSLDSLFDLTFAVFHTAWLIGWSTAPLILTLLLLLVATGREVVTARRGLLRIGIGIPGLLLAAEYDAHQLSNPRLTDPPKNSGTSWRGRHMSFDYAGRQVNLGSAVTPEDLSSVWRGIELSAQGVAGERIQNTAARETPRRVTRASEGRRAAMERETTPARLSSLSTLALIASNLVPVFGMVYFDWRLSDVMVLYWAESGVIALFNVAKIACVGKWMAIFAGVFFLSHFGAFMAVHFLFIYGLFIEGIQNTSKGDLKEVAALFVSLWPALAALFVSHGISFVTNFIGNREYERNTLQQLMTAPYARITLMHVTLIFGGFLILLLQDPVPVILLFILMKIVLDVRAHLKEHAPAHTD